MNFNLLIPVLIAVLVPVGLIIFDIFRTEPDSGAGIGGLFIAGVVAACVTLAALFLMYSLNQ